MLVRFEGSELEQSGGISILRKATHAIFVRVSLLANVMEANPRVAALAIFLLGLGLRLLAIPVAHTWPDAKTLEVTAVATSLASGRGFSDPFAALPTGLTAHVAPVYPFLVAGLFKLFGFQIGDLVKQVLSCGISASVYSFLPTIASLAGFPRRLGILAGFIGAVSLVSIEVEIIGRWEGHLATLLFVIAITLWLRYWRDDSPTSPRRAIVAGLIWGVLFLTSPAFIMVLAALSLTFFLRRPDRFKTLGYFAALMIVAGLVVTPWMIRNYRTFGTVFWIRDNAGLEFYVSNAPHSTITLAENVRAVFWELHPNMSVAAAQKLTRVGEVEFNREYMVRFKQEVRANPARFLKLTVTRALWMWCPVTRHPVRDGVFLRDMLSCAIGLFAAVGLILLPRKLDTGPLTLITALFSYQFVYWFVQASTRYRFPLAWIFCLLCAYALMQFFGFFQRRFLGEAYPITTVGSAG